MGSVPTITPEEKPKNSHNTYQSHYDICKYKRNINL